MVEGEAKKRRDAASHAGRGLRDGRARARGSRRAEPFEHDTSRALRTMCDDAFFAALAVALWGEEFWERATIFGAIAQ